MTLLIFLIIIIICFIGLNILTQYLIWGRFFFFVPIVLKIKSKPKEIFLTFDDGPDFEYTPHILDLLDKYDSKATFFLLGRNIIKNKEIVKRIIEEGHDIGNHTYSHKKLFFKSYKSIKTEIVKNDKILKEYGCKNQLFRPPYRTFAFMLPFVCLYLRKKIILWNVGSKDFKEIKSAKIVENVIKNVKTGSIITMHDGNGNRQNSVKALEVILPALLNKGYKFRGLQNYL